MYSRPLSAGTATLVVRALPKRPAASEEPQYLEDTLTIIFETQLVIKPTRFALESETLERDYYRHWQGLKKNFRR